MHHTCNMHFLDVVAKEIDRYNGRKEASLENVLFPWSKYEFRVAAANILGYGPFSAPSPQYSTLPDKPRRAPLNIGGGGGKIGDLTVTWEVRTVLHINKCFLLIKHYFFR